MIPAIWLWALTGNIRVTNTIYLVATMIVGYITFEKMNQRGEPFYPSDFRMATDLPFLMDMISPLMLVIIFSSIAFGIFAFALAFKRKKKTLSPLNWKWRTNLFLLMSLLMGYVVQFQAEGNILKKAYDRTAYWIPYSQQMNYYNNGFVAGFLYNFSSSPMQLPEGFSEEGMDVLIEKYQKKQMKSTNPEKKIK
ncbi:hypothetical protein LZ578_11230 [Jeotgalibaca sp. MA1X17-3]|uniref:hypothetical protein n=1 Tax=Jeotgalibaca sp. MA1X17-3 TaxID=2908211 RepID=UPI001F21EA56|nr:hypothetical protein [Jeotgalibaca sp. MA1X17-3]UJF15519.1 hypothetical protein LZ578_11230 [Jeotgalibaca sp. MA1X17-3]